MSVRDDIYKKVVDLKMQVAWAMDDTDLRQDARFDLQQLWRQIDSALDKFNLPDGPDLSTGCGPTQADIAGEVNHV